MWVILPGLALAPRDYAPLAALLRGRVIVADQWAVPLTSEDLPRALGLPDRGTERLDLIGHSLGGLAALSLALDGADSLTLLDPTTLGEASSHVRVPRFAAPLGALARAAAMLALTGKDPLSGAERQARYGTPAGLEAITFQLAELARLQDRISQKLGHPLPPTLHVCALPHPGASSHRSAQRAFARQIGSELIEARGWNHLFPLTHPAEVAELILAGPSTRQPPAN